MNDNDLHYLRSILGHLRMLRAIADKHGGPGLPGEALADNIDWLDCFIEKHSHTYGAEMARQHGPDLIRER